MLDELTTFAPIYAVKGNNDGPDVTSWGAAETLELDLDGLHIGVIHDSGNKVGRLLRMRNRFPTCSLVVFGHSHIPLLERSEDGTFTIFNPGSPTDKRRQPHKTMGMLRVEQGRLVDAQHLIVD